MESRRTGRSGLSLSEAATGTTLGAPPPPGPSNTTEANTLAGPGGIQGITDEELAEMEDAFRLCDVNGDGMIDSHDLIQAMSSLGLSLSDEEVQQMVEEVNAESKGAISFKEFVGFMARKMCESDSEDDMRNVFESFDSKQSGYLGPSELEKLLAAMGRDSHEAAVQHMLREADADGDGRVSFADFMQLMKASQVMFHGHADIRHTGSSNPSGHHISSATVQHPSGRRPMSRFKPVPADCGVGGAETHSNWPTLSHPCLVGPDPTTQTLNRIPPSFRAPVQSSTPDEVNEVEARGCLGVVGEPRYQRTAAALHSGRDGGGSDPRGVVQGKRESGMDKSLSDEVEGQVEGQTTLRLKPSLEERLKAFLLQVSGEEDDGGGGSGEGLAAAAIESAVETVEVKGKGNGCQMMQGTGEGSLPDQVLSPVQKGPRSLDDFSSPRVLVADGMASNEWWQDLWHHDSPRPADMLQPDGEMPEIVSGVVEFATAGVVASGNAGQEMELGMNAQQQTALGNRGGRVRGNEEGPSWPPLLVSPNMGKRFSRHLSDPQKSQDDKDVGGKGKSKKQKSV